MYHKIIRGNSKTFKQKNPQNKALGIEFNINNNVNYFIYSILLSSSELMLSKNPWLLIQSSL